MYFRNYSTEKNHKCNKFRALVISKHIQVPEIAYTAETKGIIVKNEFKMSSLKS